MIEATSAASTHLNRGEVRPSSHGGERSVGMDMAGAAGGGRRAADESGRRRRRERSPIFVRWRMGRQLDLRWAEPCHNSQPNPRLLISFLLNSLNNKKKTNSFLTKRLFCGTAS
jgi:hypothetical protein